MYLEAGLPETQISLREDLSQRLTRVCSSQRSQVLLEDRERSLNGEEILRAFQILNRELVGLTPIGGRVAICAEDPLLQAQFILSTLFCQRVPVVFGANKHEDVHEVHARMGIAAILEQFGTSWHIAPASPALVFSNQGELVDKRQTRLRSPVTPAHSTCGLILFTSGTTGNQKAVNLSLSGMQEAYQFLGHYFKLGPQDIAAVLLPLSHTFALNTQLMPSFLAGAKTTFLNHPSQLGRQYDGIGKVGATFVSSVTDLLRLLKREREVRRLAVCDQVRHVQVAAGKISTEHIADLKLLFPSAVLHKGYGMTETIRTSMISSLDPNFLSDSCGRPLPGQEVEIRNERGSRVPTGGRGQIFVRSSSVLLSYDNRPQGSSLDENGFFATGDWGYIDEHGHLACLDRLDRIFKMSGKKVSAVELEQVAIGFKGVAAAKCAPIADSKRGIRPVLFLEPENLESFGESEIRGFELWLREHLESSKVPRDVVLTRQLARTDNSKVKIASLQSLWDQKKQRAMLSFAVGFIRFHQFSELDTNLINQKRS